MWTNRVDLDICGRIRRNEKLKKDNSNKNYIYFFSLNFEVFVVVSILRSHRIALT